MPISLNHYSVTVDANLPEKSADFYQALLGWKRGEAFGFPLVSDPQTGFGLLFVKDDFIYEPPVWPEQPDKQQKQLHFDFSVPDLAEAISVAEGLGAKKASEQFLGDHGVAMIDPEGRIFDLLQG